MREFARDTLGAKRMSKQYLDALRVVLGNKADASCRRYVLELNIRVPFAAERVMRTIIDQMKRAGLTYGQGVALGNGRTQVVQCFGPRRQECADEDAPAELEADLRREEEAAPHAPAMPPNAEPWGIQASEVPH